MGDTKYEYAESSREISGFGGGYERACRAMVVAGMEFWDVQNEDFDPKFTGYVAIYGVCQEDNPDAEALTQAMMDATFTGDDGNESRVGDDCTGAMHQAGVAHILAARRLGWDEYIVQMESSREGEEHGEDW